MAKTKTTEKKPSGRTVFTNESLWADKNIGNAQLVLVHWRDIVQVSNWNEEEEVAPVRDFMTVGYLLYEGPDPKDQGEDMTVIATTWDGDMNKWRDYVVFPSPVVRTIEAMTAAKKKRAKRGPQG